jgi:hypothetical protein
MAGIKMQGLWALQRFNFNAENQYEQRANSNASSMEERKQDWKLHRKRLLIESTKAGHTIPRQRLFERSMDASEVLALVCISTHEEDYKLT